MQPVSGDPFLEPVSGDPFQSDPYTAATPTSQDPLHLGQVVESGVGEFMKRLTAPGRVASGVQSATPGVLTEEDAYRLNQLEAEAHGWGPEQAAAMIGGGVGMAEKGAAGVVGGKPSADFEKSSNRIDAKFAHGRVIGDRTVPMIFQGDVPAK